MIKLSIGILILFFYFNSYCQPNLKIEPKRDGNLSTKELKDAKIFLKKMIVSKIRYEEDSFYKRKKDMIISRKKYFHKLKIFFDSNNKFDQKLNYLFKANTKNEGDKVIQFSYDNPTSSSFPKCIFITYRNFISLMLYKLRNHKKDYMKLECIEQYFINNLPNKN